MISNKKVLALITARGGSKGIPKKNVKTLGGKPLIAWTIEAAKCSAFIDSVVVSTEDSGIAEISKSYGADVPFIRPRHLANDEAKSIDVALHALEKVPGYDFLVLLQPTSPFRTANDIDNAIKLCIQDGTSSCVSVASVCESPYWMYKRESDGTFKKLLSDSYSRRQDLPQCFILNGAIYITQINWLLKNKAFKSEDCSFYVMPEERSLDIDCEEDFFIASQRIKAE